MGQPPLEFSRSAIDPFAFWPTGRSTISGLGDDQPANMPGYVFHTAYAGYADLEGTSGAATYEVAFAELIASSGGIILHVNALPDEAGEQAVTIWTARYPLASVAAGTLPIVIPVTLAAGCRYALLGQVNGDTDAQAAGLVITLTGTTSVSKSLPDAPLVTIDQSLFVRRPILGAERLVVAK